MSGAGPGGSGETTRRAVHRRSADRWRALAASGLGPVVDPELQALSDWARTALGVPVAVVSLVQSGRQVYPGLSGLVGPWSSTRTGPLTASFGERVVDTAAPLVVADAREHPVLAGSPGVADPGVVAYAGMPLTDEEGRVLGVLSVVEDRPRTWSEVEMDTMRNIAQACSTVLRLRLARFDSGREVSRRDELETAQRLALHRSETLLRASQAFTDTSTVGDVRARIDQLVTTKLGPAYVGIVLRDEQGRLSSSGPSGDVTQRGLALMAATAIDEERITRHLTREDFDRDHPAAARRVVRDLGLHSVIVAPLPGVDTPLGAIVFGWTTPHAVEPADLLTIASIAGYAAQAIERARVLHHRISVAHEMQDAMLTTLPKVDGLVMAARYEPADTRENIGGDWYDAAPLRDPAQAAESVLFLSVGDVIGHALPAATIMGQVRSMLRQSAWDHQQGPPSAVLAAFESANFGLDLTAAGTAVLAILRRAADGWSMSWTNAGHPPPILLLPDGTSEVLEAHDALFGFRATAHLPRGDQHRDLAPGTVLFLYTDGLVERRGRDLDDGIAALLALLHELRDRPPQELVDTAVDTLGAGAADDVVAFALRIPD